MTQSDKTSWILYPLGFFGCIGMLAYGCATIWAAHAFLEDYWGWHWLLASIAICFVLIVTRGALLVPLAFFGAWLVWKWQFFGALLFAAPFLAIFIAALAGGGIVTLFHRAKQMLIRES